ncbi:LAFE_0E13476g1_1 [Lachancea fermentati]|uniref:LAFE_0E13476g1_1 n=1 Tax=Lachancea fermentati TaxID=4955 RepID=A0A1G4MEA4_LACFM|nr:LAFE_0E13476g1_1 [Lachancea fermentati]
MGSRLVLKTLKDAGKGRLAYPVENSTPPVSRDLIKSQLKDFRESLPRCITDYADHGLGFIKRNKRLSQYLKGKKTLTKARSQVHGTSSVAQVYQNANRLFSKQAKVYHCDFFRLLYFPPDHFLSLFRKSKPGVNVRIVGEVFLNGNVATDDGKQLKSTELFKQKSKMESYGRKQDVNKFKYKFPLFAGDGTNIPKNYAYLRRYLRVFVDKCFIKEWTKLNGDKAVSEQVRFSQTVHGRQRKITNDDGIKWKYLDTTGQSKRGVAKDGFYLYQVLIFPDVHTKHEFEANIVRSVQTVANLEWPVFLKGNTPGKTWVQEVNNRVRVSNLNTYLVRDQVPSVVEKI